MDDRRRLDLLRLLDRVRLIEIEKVNLKAAKLLRLTSLF
jgi:hypothetical protein